MALLRGARLALTRSAGSVAFAALITALLKTARYFFNRWKRAKYNVCFKICGLLCFASLESVFRLFNSYALAFLAMCDV